MVNKYRQILQINSLWIPAEGHFIELVKSISHIRRSDIVPQLNDSDCVNIICDSAWFNRDKKVIFNEKSIVSAQLCIDRHLNLTSHCYGILTYESKISV